MHNPPHPGGIVRRQCLEPLGLTPAAAAAALRVPERQLRDLLEEKAPLSADMAIRLSEAFGSTPETWLGLQTARDLDSARRRPGRRALERFS